MRILLVDDDPEQVQVYRKLLELGGWAVVTAAGVADAARILIREAPDVLLMDLRLPKLEDGLALIRAAAGRPQPPRILVLSGWPEDLYELPEASLVAHILTKPVRSRVLFSALKG